MTHSFAHYNCLASSTILVVLCLDEALEIFLCVSKGPVVEDGFISIYEIIYAMYMGMCAMGVTMSLVVPSFASVYARSISSILVGARIFWIGFLWEPCYMVDYG